VNVRRDGDENDTLRWVWFQSLREIWAGQVWNMIVFRFASSTLVGGSGIDTGTTLSTVKFDLVVMSYDIEVAIVKAKGKALGFSDVLLSGNSGSN
jgi:hypothetical protein